MSDRDLLTPPTPERLRKGDVKLIHGERGGKEIRSSAHPLDHYAGRDMITRPQWAAGVRLGELWEIGYVRSQHAQSRYGDPLARGKHNPGYADECRDLYDRACLALRDMGTRKLVTAVCCSGEWAGRGNIDDLRRGLDALDRHFHRSGRMD